jgi:hypothetical protein
MGGLSTKSRTSLGYSKSSGILAKSSSSVTGGCFFRIIRVDLGVEVVAIWGEDGANAVANEGFAGYSDL